MINLLVVEDDEVTRSLFQLIFAGDPWRVRLTNSVATALKAYRTESFDLIITDIFLPDCLATAIRQIEQTQDRRRIPIIGISAGVQEDNRDRCLDSGMDAFLTKPFRLDAIKVLIDNLIAAYAGR